jgi:uncharacterized protein (TIGR03067 family)
MGRLAVVAAFLFVVPTAHGDEPKKDDANAEAIKKELSLLEGGWRVVSVEVNGTNIPAALIKDHLLVIKGESFASSRPREDGKELQKQEGTLHIDPSQSPKTLDAVLKSESGVGKAVTQRSIYKLDGDNLTLCSAKSGEPRPTSFDSRGKGVTLMTLKRIARE